MIKILLYRPAKGQEYWWSKLVKFVTGSDYYHAAIWISGYIYEETAYFDSNNKWISGVRKYKSAPNGDVFSLRPGVIVDEGAIKTWADLKIDINVPYNFPLLFSMFFVYPLRWLWKILKWSPFKSAVFGYICSEFVDYCLLAGGVDLLPNRSEAYTVPGDIAESKLLIRETT